MDPRTVPGKVQAQAAPGGLSMPSTVPGSGGGVLAATGHLSGACPPLQGPQTVRPHQGHALILQQRPLVAKHSSFLGQTPLWLRLQSHTACGQGQRSADRHTAWEAPEQEPEETTYGRWQLGVWE